ncbi:MAG: DUF4129 domain-containing protein [Chromatiales bacterium]|jgi:hypothetical protein|nr:DUF4129 domain-containing protein [Chromatiales bacterium]
MHNRRVLTVVWLLADSAWLTLGLALVGWTVAQKAALMSLGMVMVGLAAAFVMGAFAPERQHEALVSNAGRRWRGLQAVLGGCLALVAMELAPATSTLSQWWPIAIYSGTAGSTQIVGMVAVAFAMLVIWRRGVAAGITGLDSSAFQETFLWGSCASILAAIADAVCGCGLMNPSVILLFFAAGLSGLALSQIPADDGNVSSWYRAVGLAVTVVLCAGFVLVHLSDAFGESIGAFAGQIWSAIVTVIIDVLVVVLGPIIIAVIGAIEWLVGAGSGSGAELRLPNLEAFSKLRREGGSIEGPTRDVIQAILLGLVALLLYKGFRRRFRDRHARPDALSFDQRERLERDIGLADLMWDLLPKWLRRRARARPGWQYPKGQPGITEAYALYFSMLDAAATKGWQFDPCLTPRERILALSRLLNGAPVAAITECFNLVCYAGRSIDLTRLDDLGKELAASQR